MTTRAFACLAVLFCFGCESDVDLCGGNGVCGVDGTTYGDRCAAASAGVDVSYDGPCIGGCGDVCELACPYGLAVGEDGCPLCDCAPPPECLDDRPCVGTDVCVMGRCGPPVVDDAGIDAPAIDADRIDAPSCPDGLLACGEECRTAGTLTDCTACDDACDAVPDGVTSAANLCKPSGCVYECTTDTLDDCDDDPSNGCETHLDTLEDCGACGNACPRFTLVCDTLDGAAAPSCQCPDRWPTVCDGRCTNTAYDAQNCGRCGNACDGGRACQDGLCVTSDSCANPANWTCNEGEGSCDVSCGGETLFLEGGGGGLNCTLDTGGTSCVTPVAPNCASCRREAALCCNPTPVVIP